MLSGLHVGEERTSTGLICWNVATRQNILLQALCRCQPLTAPLGERVLQ